MTEPEEPEDADEESRAIAVSLTKGGVGKTAISINLADRLEERGRTLLVDIDSAGNATEGVGHPDAFHADEHIGNYLEQASQLSEDEDYDSLDTTLEDVIIKREDSFDVIPSNKNLGRSEKIIDNDNRFAILAIKQELIDRLLGEVYDYIVFDTPGDADSLFRESAIYGAGNVVVPMEPGEESVRGLETLMKTEIVPAREHTDVEILAVVPNKVLSDNESKRLISELESNFPDKLPQFARKELFEDGDVVDPGIRKRVQFTRAWRQGVPLSEFDPENDMIPRLDDLADTVVRGGVRG